MENSNKILSISIASYNAQNDLKRCLDSFLKCKNLDKLELIIVNDGSKDNTLKIANEYKNKYPNSIKVIDKENGGHGSTINASIVECVGKYYKVVDSDDWVETRNLDKLVEKLETIDTDLIINPYYSVNALDFHEKQISNLKNNLEIEYNMEYKFDDKCENMHLAMHAMTIKTSIIKKVGPIIDENCFYVDTEYIIFPINFINTIIFLDYAIYDYLLGTNTQSMNVNNLIKRRSQHLKVCERLVDYFINTKFNSQTKKSVVKKRITNLIGAQYVLFLNVNPTISMKEIKEFDVWLKQKSVELYENVNVYSTKSNSKNLKLAMFLRRYNFRLYRPIVSIAQLLKKI